MPDMLRSTKTTKARKPTFASKFSKHSASSSSLVLAEGSRRRRHRVLKPVTRDPFIEMIEARKAKERREAIRRRLRGPSSHSLDPSTRRIRCANCGNTTEVTQLRQIGGGGVIANAVFAERIPERLLRPEVKDVGAEDYVKAGRDPQVELNGLRFARRELGMYGQELFSAVTSTVVSSVNATHDGELAKFMAIKMPKKLRAEYMPTHMLAIHDGNPEVKKRKVHLVPIHAQVLAAYCCRVPPLPTPSPPSPSLDPLDIITDAYYHSRIVPLIPFCIPSPDTFPLMMHFLYTQDSAFLFRSLVPIGPSNGGMWDGDFSRIPEVLAVSYTSSSIFSMSLRVYGVWQNACSLGVLNSGIWQVIDVAWKNHRNALLLAQR